MENKQNSFFRKNKKMILLGLFVLFMAANFYVIWHMGSLTEFRRGKKTEQAK